MRAKKRQIQGQTSCPVRGAGFTLVEVMLVMVISGLLAAIALAAYQTQLIKGRRVDAVNALSDVLHAQERWRSNRNSYAAALSDLQLAPNSPAKLYSLSLSGLGNPASFSTGFIARAIPMSGGIQSRDIECAELSLSLQGGNVSYSAKNSKSADSSRQCWPQ